MYESQENTNTNTKTIWSYEKASYFEYFFRKKAKEAASLEIWEYDLSPYTNLPYASSP